MVIKNSVAQFPEGRAGTANTVLNFCLDGGFLGQVTLKHGTYSKTSRISPDTLTSGDSALMPEVG